MAQIKVYGIQEHLNPIKAKLSEVIHSWGVVEALQFLLNKRTRFSMSAEDFHFPARRNRPLHHYRDQHVRGPLPSTRENA